MINRRQAAVLAITGIAAHVAYRNLRRRDLSDKAVFISGGSRGLGLELARQFLEHGAKVTICGRTASTLDEAATALRADTDTLLTVEGNISQPISTQTMIDQHMARWGRLDILVNNASLFITGPLTETVGNDTERQLQTNLWGTMSLTDAALPALRRSRGQVVTISSAAAMLPIPYLGTYGISKAAQARWAEALGLELRGQGVTSLVVYPSFMKTDFADASEYRGEGIERQRKLFAAMTHFPGLSVPPNAAATKIIRAVRERRRYLVISKLARITLALSHVAPETVRMALGASFRLAQRYTRDSLEGSNKDSVR